MKAPIATVMNEEGDLRVRFFDTRPFLRVVIERRTPGGSWRKTDTLGYVVHARVAVHHVFHSFNRVDNETFKERA